MISIVPTSRSFHRPAVLTWPLAVVSVLYFSSIAALAWFKFHTPYGFTPCLLKNTTGVPCFLCGGTRASLALAKGEMVSSFFFNPLVCLLWILGAALLLLKIVGGRRVLIAPIPRRWLWLGGIFLVAANWAFVITQL